jgi:hypothetical protein
MDKNITIRWYNSCLAAMVQNDGHTVALRNPWIKIWKKQKNQSLQQVWVPKFGKNVTTKGNQDCRQAEPQTDWTSILSGEQWDIEGARKKRVLSPHIYINQRGELIVTLRLIMIIAGRSIITGIVTAFLELYDHKSITTAPAVMLTRLEGQLLFRWWACSSGGCTNHRPEWREPTPWHARHENFAGAVAGEERKKLFRLL